MKKLLFILLFISYSLVGQTEEQKKEEVTTKKFRTDSDKDWIQSKIKKSYNQGFLNCNNCQIELENELINTNGFRMGWENFVFKGNVINGSFVGKVDFYSKEIKYGLTKVDNKTRNINGKRFEGTYIVDMSGSEYYSKRGELYFNENGLLSKIIILPGYEKPSFFAYNNARGKTVNGEINFINGEIESIYTDLDSISLDSKVIKINGVYKIAQQTKKILKPSDRSSVTSNPDQEPLPNVYNLSSNQEIMDALLEFGYNSGQKIITKQGSYYYFNLLYDFNGNSRLAGFKNSSSLILNEKKLKIQKFAKPIIDKLVKQNISISIDIINALIFSENIIIENNFNSFELKPIIKNYKDILAEPKIFEIEKERENGWSVKTKEENLNREVESFIKTSSVENIINVIKRKPSLKNIDCNMFYVSENGIKELVKGLSGDPLVIKISKNNNLFEDFKNIIISNINEDLSVLKIKKENEKYLRKILRENFDFNKLIKGSSSEDRQARKWWEDLKNYIYFNLENKIGFSKKIEEIKVTISKPRKVGSGLASYREEYIDKIKLDIMFFDNTSTSLSLYPSDDNKIWDRVWQFKIKYDKPF